MAKMKRSSVVDGVECAKTRRRQNKRLHTNKEIQNSCHPADTLSAISPKLWPKHTHSGNELWSESVGKRKRKRKTIGGTMKCLVNKLRLPFDNTQLSLALKWKLWGAGSFVVAVKRCTAKWAWRNGVVGEWVSGCAMMRLGWATL